MISILSNTCLHSKLFVGLCRRSSGFGEYSRVLKVNFLPPTSLTLRHNRLSAFYFNPKLRKSNVVDKLQFQHHRFFCTRKNQKDWNGSPESAKRCFRWEIPIGVVLIFGCTFYFYFRFPSVASSSESPPVNVVLLSCGSFNPPTIMHLRMFELARDYLRGKTKYRAVEGVISPVHHGYGKKGLIATEHRIEMLRLATKNAKWLFVDDWEAKQAHYCRTVVVLRHTKDVRKDRVMLLCGADLLKSFEVPNLWKPEDMEEILRDFGVVVVTRVGTDLSNVIAQSEILSRYKDNIHVVTEKISNDISSTKIRQALKDGDSVRYFVPDGSLDYIYERQLYDCGVRTF